MFLCLSWRLWCLLCGAAERLQQTRTQHHECRQERRVPCAASAHVPNYQRRERAAGDCGKREAAQVCGNCDLNAQGRDRAARASARSGRQPRRRPGATRWERIPILLKRATLTSPHTARPRLHRATAPCAGSFRGCPPGVVWGAWGAWRRAGHVASSRVPKVSCAPSLRGPCGASPSRHSNPSSSSCNDDPDHRPRPPTPPPGL